MGVYTASNALQIVLLVFFGGKLLYAAGIAKAWPRRRNYVEYVRLLHNAYNTTDSNVWLRVTPTFFVILIALSIVIVNLIPGLLRFADTPLGRFFILVEMVRQFFPNCCGRWPDRSSRISKFILVLDTVRHSPILVS